MKDIIFDPPTKFDFKCGDYVPFKDREVCERLRKISGTDLEKHENPDFHIKVMMNPHPVLIATLFSRLKAASEVVNRGVTVASPASSGRVKPVEMGMNTKYPASARGAVMSLSPRSGMRIRGVWKA